MITTIVIGWIGVVLLAAAWLVESYQVVKKAKSDIPLYFTIIYIFGSGLLVLYSVLIKDLVFIVLNGMATLSAIIHLIVSLRYK